MKGLIPYALALLTVASVAVAQQPSFIATTSPPEQPTQPNEATRRLTINVSFADPDDLKVTKGDRLTVGQLIADRIRDSPLERLRQRNRLEAQARQLDLTLQRLKHSTITPPLPPATPPPNQPTSKKPLPLPVPEPMWTRLKPRLILSNHPG